MLLGRELALDSHLGAVIGPPAIRPVLRAYQYATPAAPMTMSGTRIPAAIAPPLLAVSWASADEGFARGAAVGPLGPPGDVGAPGKALGLLEPPGEALGAKVGPLVLPGGAVVGAFVPPPKFGQLAIGIMVPPQAMF